jgi:hypothetical protein
MMMTGSMFETQIETPRRLPGIVRYFAQLILSYPVVGLAALPISAMLSLLGLGVHANSVHFAGYAAVLCGFLVGPVVGLLIGRGEPRLVHTGRWIWVLPAAVVIPAAVRDLIPIDGVPWLPESFFATPSNEGLGVYLFTLPAFCALGYSIGMAFTEREIGGDMLLCWALLLVVLVGVAHAFEVSRLEEWSRVRFVVDPDGAKFSEEPNLLCTTGDALLLTRPTAMETLERRDCGPGRLLEPDEPRRSGSWEVQRVRVLNGPHKGAVGWVRSYAVAGMN